MDNDQVDDEDAVVEDLPVVEDDDVDVDKSDEKDDQLDVVETEYEDFEIDGKVYSLPKELKDSVMKSSDYTQKTQELAEGKRILESRQTEFQNSQARRAQQFNSYAELSNIDNQLKGYENVDWAQLQADNPELAQQHQFALLQLQEQKRAKVEDIQKQEQLFSTEQHGAYAKQSEENNRVIAGEIEGWGEEVAYATAQQAETLGFTPKFIDAVNMGMFPEAVPMIKAVHKAHLYDQLIAKAKKVSKDDKIKIVPSNKVSGRKPSRKNTYSKDMSTEERLAAWAKNK